MLAYVSLSQSRLDRGGGVPIAMFVSRCVLVWWASSTDPSVSTFRDHVDVLVWTSDAG